MSSRIIRSLVFSSRAEDGVPTLESSKAPLLDPDVDKLVKCSVCGNAFYAKKWIIYNKKLLENCKCPFCESKIRL